MYMPSPQKMKKKRPTMSIAFVVIVLAFVPGCIAQIQAPPAPVEQFTAQLNTKIAELTRSFYPEVKKLAGFCIKDLEADYNRAFNFSSDVKFLSDCFASSSDFSQRICTAAEIKAYFVNFYSSDDSTRGSLNPNRNCNFTTYVPGCEPGWGCSLNQDQTNQQDIDLLQADNMPLRTRDCKPCCAGFFCPYGITCMIPCPLGSYCPTAKLNQTTGFCEPYKYQPPLGQPNHTCGGADVWADVGNSIDMFCEEGSYCPSTIEKYDCSSGYFCRLGSTSRNKCFTGSCKANSGHQDMKIFSAIFIVALSLLLLIVYNCSDRILAFRERRQAKSRENAARIVRESAVARAKWKAAKEGAMKHVFQLQSQISRKFSRSRISESDEEYILSDIVHEPEQSPDISEDVSTEIEEVKIKKKLPKAKKAHTPSQIFRYAYGEIEKEKSVHDENKNMTFSEVVSKAANNGIRTRPVIEITFKDLTLVLKRSKKQLLKYVTGKLEPGRVTAVMGPSGAGKTTFLTALAGNTAGCEITGSVLINGKKDPIRSYKKLIGFVPQDDIVHGNLTVEENLWFSARCRLSVSMSRADKVLVVERTIECLGLQAIRDSLVGTVEKRGISGGQRKRVNVGLEMVMEPSLLILDEPTSGLDSSSSQLLLRALRREALEGVNVCAVIHQPSYTLFNMFDDLILLAKGGLIAYHGPVKKVEEYFGSLGIIVPERVNPPDHYIDILEGMLKTDSTARIKYNQLPLIWMLRNGYSIPAKMQDELNSIDRSILSGESNPISCESDDLSNEERSNSEAHPAARQAKSNYNFYRAKDLANRRTPGILVQYRYYLGRVTKQRLREAGSLAVDLLILGLAGVCLGLIAKVSDQNFGLPGYIYTIIAVSLLCQIAALRSFSLEKLQFMRERSSGMSSLAYFLSRDTIDHFSTVFKPAIYLSMFYFLTSPRSSFTDNYIITLALIYCVTGIGYTFAICFQPSSAQLWSALLPVVLTLLVTQKGISKIVTSLCYPKWALEAFMIVNAERYPGVWLITRCAALYTRQYNINHFGLCIGVLFLYGFAFRCIAFIFMVLIMKK